MTQWLVCDIFLVDFGSGGHKFTRLRLQGTIERIF